MDGMWPDDNAEENEQQLDGYEKTLRELNAEIETEEEGFFIYVAAFVVVAATAAVAPAALPLLAKSFMVGAAVGFDVSLVTQVVTTCWIDML